MIEQLKRFLRQLWDDILFGTGLFGLFMGIIVLSTIAVLGFCIFTVKLLLHILS